MKTPHASYRIDRWSLSPKRKRAAPESNLDRALKDEARYRGIGDPDDYEQKLAKQLIHIRGSIGGVWRREGRHLESAHAYDSGYELERAESGYQIVDSYTLVQRLVARVLLDPAAAEDKLLVVEGLRVHEELRRAADLIRNQIAPGKKREHDEYAIADLGMVLLLLGDHTWRDELSRFFCMKNAGYAIEVTLDVLNDLRKAVGSPRASEELKHRLAEAVGLYPNNGQEVTHPIS
ncbi:MAG: hypothetical protein LAQ69_22115 [Acidobacteriia bacterium]|nr:hypothetical protein [Terriglobia bacterium]